MQLFYVSYNNAPVSVFINPILFTLLSVTSCTVSQNKVFLAFDFGLNNEVFLK